MSCTSFLVRAIPPTEGLYTYEGSDEPTEGVSDGRPLANWFHDNDVTNTKKGVKLKNSDNIKLTSENACTLALRLSLAVAFLDAGADVGSFFLWLLDAWY